MDYQAEYDEYGRKVKILALTEILNATISYQKVNTESLVFQVDTLEELDLLQSHSCLTL